MTMIRHFLCTVTIAAGLAAGALTTSVAPASAIGGLMGNGGGAPSCVVGFAAIQQLDWLLKCQRTVPVALMGVAVTQANNANCNTSSYWNYGPNTTTQVNRGRGTATVTYICGHVEG